MMFSINLGYVNYTKDGTNEVVPFKAYTTTTGFFGGYKWKAIDISINKNENGKGYRYDVAGTIESSLLGATVHYQYKHFTGIINGE